MRRPLIKFSYTEQDQKKELTQTMNNLRSVNYLVWHQNLAEEMMPEEYIGKTPRKQLSSLSCRVQNQESSSSLTCPFKQKPIVF